jgi:hypothetical protein
LKAAGRERYRLSTTITPAIAQLEAGRDYFLWADLPVLMVGIMLALSCPG